MTSPGDASVGRFLTVADTAEILSITVTEATDLVRSGELPAIRVGASGLWRVERVILEAYIDAKYEESRRLALWLQADFAALPELSGGAIVRPAD